MFNTPIGATNMDTFDTLHLVLLAAISILIALNVHIHTRLDHANKTLAMTLMLIKDIAEGKAKLVRRANGDIALEVTAREA
jgi:hypothetical protein